MIAPCGSRLSLSAAGRVAQRLPARHPRYGGADAPALHLGPGVDPIDRLA
jgi:hypothetical protein